MTSIVLSLANKYILSKKQKSSKMDKMPIWRYPDQNDEECVKLTYAGIIYYLPIKKPEEQEQEQEEEETVYYSCVEYQE